MKNLIPVVALASLLLLFTFSVSSGQTLPTDPETNKITYQEAVSLDTVSKDELFDRAYEWMVNFYKTNKLDVKDKINYKLVHEGNFPVSYTYDFKYKSHNTVTYNMSVDFKDGKYRFTMSDFKIYDDKIGVKSAQPLEVYYQKMKTAYKNEFTTNFSSEVTNTIEDLKKYMMTGKGEEKDDW